MRVALAQVVIFASAAACSSGVTVPSLAGGPGGSDGGGGGGGGVDGGGSGGAAGSYVGPSESGRATYYAADGSGNCSFDPSPNDLDVAAMDDPEWNGSAVCGECVAVAGPKGDVTVRIVDRCPECEMGHLDLSQSAFAKIADVSAGNVAITWHVVECNVSGPVTYHYKDGTSQYWTAIQVRNSRLPITSLEIQGASGFAPVNRESYNYFVDASGAGAAAITVRITSLDGQELVDTLTPPASDISVTGGVQFQ